MRNFLNCNIINVLNVFMRMNTEHYQTDFNYDKEIIADAANSSDPLDKTLLWLSRPNGTECFLERKVYIRDTCAHNSWKFYDEQTSDNIIAFAVEIKGIEDGKIIGDIYQLDYHWQCKDVVKNALPAHSVILNYEDGEKTLPYVPNFFSTINHYGLKGYNFLPEDMKALEDRLHAAKSERHKYDYYSKWTLNEFLKYLTVPSSGMEM